ncbi:hypothetical protein [Pedobacter sp. BAL39]|uniref:hypothetical protein n=1 Tax=Pedobacter sp. BAL39 TaxID=391596 RepID=UPI0012F96F83|nr:hypothetical protein [Pedobacter sp. BAL39]
MRQLNKMMMASLLLVAGCAGGGGSRDASAPTAVETQDSTKIMDTLAGKATMRQGEKNIVPGESIGSIHLGQDAAQLSDILGKADDGDAAMGKAWGIWNQDGGGQLSVYTSYKDSTAVAKDVKQIVVSSEHFVTEQGIRSGSSFATVKKTFPQLQLAETYINGKETLKVYDDIERGIAFDVMNKNGEEVCVAITVHPVKTAVNNTYLTIHPGWQPK